MFEFISNPAALVRPELLFFGAVFATVVFLVLSLGAILKRAMPAQHSRHQATVGGGTRKASLRPSAPDSEVGSWLAQLGTKISPDKAEDRSLMRARLVRAGFRSPYVPTMYYGVRIALALVMPVLSIVGLVLTVGMLAPVKLFIALFAASTIGFYLPTLWLAQVIARRSRDAEEGFPDALDMLLVCVEAGAGISQAIDRVSREIAEAHPVLAEELRLMALEINAGTSRATALRRFAARLGVADVSSFVTLLIQSEEFGTSIADSLRVQADEMRSKRMLRAEEKANKLPAKMALPLMLLIFPALLIIIMTPVAIRIVRAMAVS